jgi:Fur family peroxide stress response transcriptional regulator
VERWCREFEKGCRERGLRVTAQRRAIFRSLAEDLRHPTADDLHERLRGELPTLSRTTVYRVLESLEQHRLVRRVSTSEGAGRFDANVAPHQHLVCRQCGRITDFEDASLRPLPVPASVPGGFEAEALDVRIVGICAECNGN